MRATTSSAIVECFVDGNNMINNTLSLGLNVKKQAKPFEFGFLFADAQHSFSSNFSTAMVSHLSRTPSLHVLISLATAKIDRHIGRLWHSEYSASSPLWLRFTILISLVANV